MVGIIDDNICPATGGKHHRIQGHMGTMGQFSDRTKSKCAKCGVMGWGPMGLIGPPCNTCGYPHPSGIKAKKFVGTCSECDSQRVYPPTESFLIAEFFAPDNHSVTYPILFTEIGM